MIEIHLATAGALGFVGHPHLIQARIAQGTFLYDPADFGKSSVELVVNTGSLRVIDSEASAKDRQQIQRTMESDRVLAAKRYPKIVFRSRTIESLTHNHLRVVGNLTIRSQTQPVMVEVTLQQTGTRLKAAGESRFKQTTFGIRPVTAGLGTVRVKDEIDISFEVVAEPKPPGD